MVERLLLHKSLLNHNLLLLLLQPLHFSLEKNLLSFDFTFIPQEMKIDTVLFCLLGFESVFGVREKFMRNDKNKNKNKKKWRRTKKKGSLLIESEVRSNRVALTNLLDLLLFLHIDKLKSQSCNNFYKKKQQPMNSQHVKLWLSPITVQIRHAFNELESDN